MAKDRKSSKPLASFEQGQDDEQEAEEEPATDFGGVFCNSFEAGGGAVDDLLVCGCCPPEIPVQISTREADVNLLQATAQLALEAEVVTFAVDSGAAATVIDPKTSKDYPLLENAESRASETYRSAFGGQVPDSGTRALVGTVGETGTVRGMKARVAKVVRPLCSVFEIV